MPETLVRPLASSSPAPRLDVRVRVLAALSVLTLAGTYLAAQVDFLRRHNVGFPAIEPKRYWLPQITHIWLPGLGAALLLAVAAFVLHRRSRAA